MNKIRKSLFQILNQNSKLFFLTQTMPVLNNVHVWKESLLIVLTLFLPLLCSFLFSVDIIKTLSINATRNLFLDIIVIYLITVLLNGVVPFKNAKTNIIAAGITPLIWTLSFFLFCITIVLLLIT